MKNNREQWFIDRIGKRVFRNSFGCECQGCIDVVDNGIMIESEIQADYLCMNECGSEANIRYFDTKEEVN